MSQSAAAAPAVLAALAAATASVAARSLVLVLLLQDGKYREFLGRGRRLLARQPLHHRFHCDHDIQGCILLRNGPGIMRGVSGPAARTAPSASRRSPGRRASRP